MTWRTRRSALQGKGLDHFATIAGPQITVKTMAKTKGSPIVFTIVFTLVPLE